MDSIKKEVIACYNNEEYFSALFIFEKYKLYSLDIEWEFRYAELLRLCGRFEDSLIEFKKLQIKVVDKELLYSIDLNIGLIFKEMGNYEDAKIMFKKCILSEHKNELPYVFLNSVISSKNDDNLYCIALLQEGLSYAEIKDEVYYNLAMRYALIKDYSSALVCAAESLKIDPDYPKTQVLLRDMKWIATNVSTKVGTIDKTE